MRYGFLLRVPAAVALVAGIWALHGQSVPEPTCAGCGARSSRGSITHRRGCPYGPGEETREPEAPIAPQPPPRPVESKFDRDKKGLLNRLKSSETAERPFDGEKKNLLGRIQGSESAPTHFAGGKADLLGRLSGGAATEDPAVTSAIGNLALKSPTTLVEVKAAIEQRRASSSADVDAVIRSFKTKAPPPLSGRFDRLKLGDVLLVRQPDNMLSVDFYTSGWIIILDKAMSTSLRPRASHTFMFVKEVKGVKLFLDNMPGQGTLIKTEAQILAEYGDRNFDVAQPLSAIDSGRLWKASRALGIRSLREMAKRADNWIDTTDYGPFGDGEMVCSETSRWALMKAGLAIPETRSAVKRGLGRMVFGPADFYLDKDHFLVTPLSDLTDRRTKPK